MGCEVKNGDVFIFIGSSRKLMKLLHDQLNDDEDDNENSS
jgi:hypothetical protein